MSTTGKKISETRLTGNMKYGAVIYFTETEGAKYNMQYGHTITKALHELEWSPMTGRGYAAMFNN